VSLRGRELALLLQHHGQDVEALGAVGARLAGQRATQGEPLLGERAGAVEAAEVAVQAGETGEEGRAQLGPAGKLATGGALAALEKLAERRRVA
jgi:hypothetical protein